MSVVDGSVRQAKTEGKNETINCQHGEKETKCPEHEQNCNNYFLGPLFATVKTTARKMEELQRLFTEAPGLILGNNNKKSVLAEHTSLFVLRAFPGLSSLRRDR